MEGARFADEVPGRATGKEDEDAVRLVQFDALAVSAGKFPREVPIGVWVNIPSALYDPVCRHEVYNTYLDQLEFAETASYDGIGVNKHHANAYGLMPSPCLMAAALARRTSKSALVVLGSSIALYEPPSRVAEEFAMLDVISGAIIHPEPLT